MVARGVVSQRPQGQRTGAAKSSRAPGGSSKSSRVPDRPSTNHSATRPDKSQTASTSHRSALPPQPSDRDKRRADKVAEAEEARSRLKDSGPSKATGQSLAKGKKPPRKQRIQSDGEDTDDDDEDDEVRDDYNLGSTNVFTFRLYAGAK